MCGSAGVVLFRHATQKIYSIFARDARYLQFLKIFHIAVLRYTGIVNNRDIKTNRYCVHFTNITLLYTRILSVTQNER